MTHDRVRRLHRPFASRRSLSILAIVGVLAAMAQPAVAKPKHGHGHGYGHGHDSCSSGGHGHAHYDRYPAYGRHEHRQVFAAPPRVLQRVEVYEPYYERTVYFRPHHHRHAVYVFPVAVEHGYAYQPYQYCDGQLFRGFVEYAGPRVHVGVGF